MTIDDIKQLIDVVRETRIAELEVQWGENRVRIRSTPATNQEFVVPAVLPLSVASPGGAGFVAASNVSAPVSDAAAESTSETVADEGNLLVKSPIVGTYYDSPSPGAPSFVKVGDRVEPKQVLCIIESMKLMNEIEADSAGTVIAKHVENSRPVEYGESLFTIRPS